MTLTVLRNSICTLMAFAIRVASATNLVTGIAVALMMITDGTGMGVAGEAMAQETPAPVAPPVETPLPALCTGTLSELQEKERVLQQWEFHDEDLLVKLGELAEKSKLEKKSPDPALLKPISTAAGYRSKEYDAAPQYIKDIVDQVEHNFVVDIKDIYKLLAITFEGDQAPTAPERADWAHLIVEYGRLETARSLFEAAKTQVSECIKAQEPAEKDNSGASEQDTTGEPAAEDNSAATQLDNTEGVFPDPAAEDNSGASEHNTTEEPAGEDNSGATEQGTTEEPAGEDNSGASEHNTTEEPAGEDNNGASEQNTTEEPAGEDNSGASEPDDFNQSADDSGADGGGSDDSGCGCGDDQ